MNLKLRVWLPPDGDSRMVRFQGDVAVALGVPGLTAIPPYLELEPQDQNPSGPVTAGAWKLDRGTFALEALDARGAVGCFRMGLAPGRVWTEPDLAFLPAPPDWAWTRGRLAWLTIEESQDPGVILWSWKPLSGWRSDPPKG